MSFAILRAGPADLPAIAPLRLALWPDSDGDDLAGYVRDPEYLLLLARSTEGQAIGFAEASIRSDYVNGCDTSPVAFAEGVYVDPAHRRHGIARALIAAVAAWGREKGMSELGSDALLDNLPSHALHAALGFAETERVVCFRKAL